MNDTSTLSQDNPMVVLHGASGTQGTIVSERLSAAGFGVRPAHRGGSPACDFDDADSLAEVYAGAAAVVVQLPLVFSEQAVVQAQNVVEAVGRSGVGRVVFNVNGPLSPVPIGMPYVDARAILAAELPKVTEAVSISPVGPYMENLSAPGLGGNIARGRVTYPLPAEAPIPWVAIRDMGDMIADSLRSDFDVAEGGTVRLLAGPELLTGPDLASALSSVRGHQIEWETISADAFEGLLVDQIGPEAAAGIAGFYAAEGPPPPDPEMLEFGATTIAVWAAGADWPAGS